MWIDEQMQMLQLHSRQFDRTTRCSTLLNTVFSVPLSTLHTLDHVQHYANSNTVLNVHFSTLCPQYHIQQCTNCIILRHSFLPLSFISAQCHAFTAWPHDCASLSAVLAREIKFQFQPLRDIEFWPLHIASQTVLATRISILTSNSCIHCLNVPPHCITISSTGCNRNWFFALDSGGAVKYLHDTNIFMLETTQMLHNAQTQSAALGAIEIDFLP